MERWTLEGYKRPALIKRDVSLVEDSVTIGTVTEAVDVKVDGIAGIEAARVVSQLMDPASDIWKQLRRNSSPAWIKSLAAQLDGLSLIEETDSGIDDVSKGLDQAAGMCSRVARNLAEIVARRMTTYLETLSAVDDLLNGASMVCDASNDAAHAFPYSGNFALQAIHFQFAYARENAPALFAPWRRVLDEVFELIRWSPNQASGTQRDVSVHALPPSVAAIDPRDLQAYLLSFAHFVEIAPLRAGKRLTAVDDFACGKPCAGLTLAARTERMLARALEQLGASRYADALLSNSAEISPLVQGLYIEQYHVTDRFVEIIAPLMTKRFRREVRLRLFQYFQEEYGHEAFELATCVALGLDEDNVRCSVPLPLTTLYIDAYTVIARQRPVALFAALMVTEGLLGQESPVHARLAELVESTARAGSTASRHTDLNDELNHASLARLFLADVPFVSPADQLYSLEAALFILEVNFRQLESVAMYYGDHQQLSFYGIK